MNLRNIAFAKQERLDMKVFYFGSVCSNAVFNSTVEKSKIKPSASAQNFEYALIKGFGEYPDMEVTAVSAESIAAFPGGNRLFLNKRQDVLLFEQTTQILPALNLPGIKQMCHALGAERALKRWARKNAAEKDKCVLVYGIYPQVVKRLQQTCKKYGCKIFAVVTDIPSTMFTYSKSKHWLKRIFSGSYRRLAISLQDKFDGYVYLTEAMQNEIAPGKPYVVVETIADTAVFSEMPDSPKATPPALMYAGALYQKYGVDLIVDSFEKVQTNCELWLFGSGDYESEIQRRAGKNPKIRFFGRVSRQEVLKREKEATLLLNIRNAQDEYTKYSFPSKMIEYMLSGTPLFTTALPGVPNEYGSYCYMTSDRNAAAIAAQIDRILTEENFLAFGDAARKFVTEHKNSRVQAGKIRAFLLQQIQKG